MIKIGDYNDLRIVKEVDFGIYLDGGELGEILLPTKYVPLDCKVDEEIEVFIHHDSEGRIIATTKEAKACVGGFALMEVVAIAPFGAFLNWGLDKDLLLPLNEQKFDVERGHSYIAHVYLDERTGKIAASTKVDKFLNNTPPDYEVNEEVDLLISHKTDLGYVVIINGEHSGILYHNEVFRPINRGETIKGYIKKVREDDRIDVYLQKDGFEKIDDLSYEVMTYLENNDGYLELNDKSSPEEISRIFEVSKKSFKKALGTLYKYKKITIESDGIRLV